MIINIVFKKAIMQISFFKFKIAKDLNGWY